MKKILLLMMVCGLAGCGRITRKTVTTHVENCFLGNWDFSDASGYITYREIQGSPFDCEMFNGKTVELTTQRGVLGDVFIKAKIIEAKP